MKGQRRMRQSWSFLAIVCKSYQFLATHRLLTWQVVFLDKIQWKKILWSFRSWKRCRKALFSFCGASHAILRIAVLEKVFSFLGLSMWYHQRSCSNGRKEWVSRILLSFHTETKGYLCECRAHRTCLHTQLFFSLCLLHGFFYEKKMTR